MSYLRLQGTPTIEEIQELVRVDISTGDVVWAKNRKGRARAGDRVGSVGSHGYFETSIANKRVLLHHVVWASAYGEWPTDGIDHIDGDRQNNAISNLRLATKSQNGRNRPKQANNKSGCKGVSWHAQAQKWRATIMHNRKQHYLGLFDDVETAAAAYRSASVRLHGEYGRVS
jgi:hypothetical protein